MNGRVGPVDGGTVVGGGVVAGWVVGGTVPWVVVVVRCTDVLVCRGAVVGTAPAWPCHPDPTRAPTTMAAPVAPMARLATRAIRRRTLISLAAGRHRTGPGATGYTGGKAMRSPGKIKLGSTRSDRLTATTCCQ